MKTAYSIALDSLRHDYMSPFSLKTDVRDVPYSQRLTTLKNVMAHFEMDKLHESQEEFSSLLKTHMSDCSESLHSLMESSMKCPRASSSIAANNPNTQEKILSESSKPEIT